MTPSGPLPCSLALCLVGFGLGCGGSEGDTLSNEIPCTEAAPCPEGATCLKNICTPDGTLPATATCSDSRQCEAGLVCREEVCQSGCGDVYYLDDCTEQSWCKPVAGEVVLGEDGEVPAGECAPSECDPSSTDFCDDGIACVAISADVGACLPYCEYGFTGGTATSGGYYDTCEDVGGMDYACQPLGLTQVPVCLPAGGSEGPTAGVPGCDAIRSPCQAGAICVHIVCRSLCSTGQLDPCGTGEVCGAVAQRTDLSYCRAD